MAVHPKTELLVSEVEIEKIRLIKDQPLELCRLRVGLADGGPDVDCIRPLGGRRHHTNINRTGRGPVNCLAVETPLIRKRPGAFRLHLQHHVRVDTDHRLNWSRRGGHGDVGDVDDLHIGRRADARQDGIQHGGLAARVAHGVANDHLVAAHVFRLKVVDRVGRLRGPLDVLVFKPPQVGERLGALGLNR